MMHEHFHAALEALDVPLLRKMSGVLWPGIPQPASDAEALAEAHHARTQMPSMPFAKRAYSHAWLMERSLPSGLPDHMRPRAQRMYPVTVASVGIAVRGMSEIGRAASPLIRQEMEMAVLGAYADGHANEPGVVKARMLEMRSRAIKRWLG